MTDHGDIPPTLDDPVPADLPVPDETPIFEAEATGADAEAWSPVMSVPPPDAPPAVDDGAFAPPHELADDGPPPPPPPGGDDVTPPPPPPPPGDGELPPPLPGDAGGEEPFTLPVPPGGEDMPPPPFDPPGEPVAPGPGDVPYGHGMHLGDEPLVADAGPVSLSEPSFDVAARPGDLVDADPGNPNHPDNIRSEGHEAPMPPITGEHQVDLPPPAPAGDLDLGAPPPPPPDGSIELPGDGSWSPVMGTPPPDGPGADEWVPEPEGMTPGVGADGQRTWTDEEGRQFTLDPDTGHLLWTDPETGDVWHRDATFGEVIHINEGGTNPYGVSTDETPEPEVVPEDPGGWAVEPGEARQLAEALADDWLPAGTPDDVRARFVDLLTEAAEDGFLSDYELTSAWLQAMAGPEDASVADMAGDQEVVVLIRIEGEGLDLFRASPAGDEVELQSVRSGSSYALPASALDQGWRSSGSVVLAAAPEAPVEEIDDAEEVAAVEPDGSGSSLARNLLMGGAVLLPIAGAATYVATRKIR